MYVLMIRVHCVVRTVEEKIICLCENIENVDNNNEVFALLVIICDAN